MLSIEKCILTAEFEENTFRLIFHLINYLFIWSHIKYDQKPKLASAKFFLLPSNPNGSALPAPDEKEVLKGSEPFREPPVPKDSAPNPNDGCFLIAATFGVPNGSIGF